VQRGEAKLAVNAAKLSEYLALAPSDVNPQVPLLSGPLPERKRSIRKRIAYVERKAQHEELLLEGTCAAKADCRYF